MVALVFNHSRDWIKCIFAGSSLQLFIPTLLECLNIPTRSVLTSEEWRLHRTHRFSSCLGRRGTHPVWVKEVWLQGQDSPGEPSGMLSTSSAMSVVLPHPPSKVKAKKIRKIARMLQKKWQLSRCQPYLFSISRSKIKPNIYLSFI